MAGYRDLVQVYKDESAAGGGTAGDAEPFPTTINPSQDAIESAGLVLNDWNGGTPVRDQTVKVIRSGNNLQFIDPIAGTKNLAQLATALDLLLAEDPDSAGNTYAYTTNANGTINVETWTHTAAAHTWKTITYAYLTGTRARLVSSVVTKVFDTSNGTTVLAQMTETYTYTGNKITSSTKTRDV